MRRTKKQCGIHHDWQNIVRIMNSQKVGTITMNQRNNKQKGMLIPSAGVQEIYTVIGYKSMPFYQKILCSPNVECR